MDPWHRQWYPPFHSGTTRTTAATNLLFLRDLSRAPILTKHHLVTKHHVDIVLEPSSYMSGAGWSVGPPPSARLPPANCRNGPPRTGGRPCHGRRIRLGLRRDAPHIATGPSGGGVEFRRVCQVNAPKMRRLTNFPWLAISHLKVAVPGARTPAGRLAGLQEAARAGLVQGMQESRVRQDGIGACIDPVGRLPPPGRPQVFCSCATLRAKSPFVATMRG